MGEWVSSLHFMKFWVKWYLQMVPSEAKKKGTYSHQACSPTNDVASGSFGGYSNPCHPIRIALEPVAIPGLIQK